MRDQGFTVESVCRVLREQGCQIAARTYRAWRTRPPSARSVIDAKVRQTIEDLGFTTDAQGRRRLTPEEFYGSLSSSLCERSWSWWSEVGVDVVGVDQ